MRPVRRWSRCTSKWRRKGSHALLVPVIMTLRAARLQLDRDRCTILFVAVHGQFCRWDKACRRGFLGRAGGSVYEFGRNLAEGRGRTTQGWMPVGWSGDGHVLITASGGQVSLSRSSPLDGYWSGIACSADGSRVNAAIDDYLDGPVYTGVFPRTGPILTTSPTNQAVVVGSNAG